MNADGPEPRSPRAALELKMTAAQIVTLIQGGFASKQPMLAIDELQPGRARVRMPFRDWMLRPGGTLSGPTLFTVADLAMYVLVLAHVGPELMAVTANLNINFMARPAPGDALADGRLLKLGRRLAVMEVSLFSAAAPEILVAHVTGSYALPARP